MSGPRLVLQRMRVDAQGYDDTGAYWGAGPDVFIATTPDGAEEITVRGRTAADARRKVAELLSGKQTATAEAREPLGGKSPHITRHQMTWQNQVTAETVRLRITHARDYLGLGRDHIEVESLHPRKAPLPITETGYRSHFMEGRELARAGGAVAFVTSWLAQESGGKAWRSKAQAAAQGDLFAWAAAQSEVAPGPKPPLRRKRAPRVKQSREPGAG